MNESAVRKGIQSYQAIANDIQRFEALLSENAAALSELEARGDLADKKVLAEIIERQALAALYPRRIDALNADLDASAQVLAKTVGHFVSGDLRKRVAEVGCGLRAKVRAGLAFAFNDESLLSRAVEDSQLIRRFIALDFSCSVEADIPNGVVDYAERKLAVLASVDELAKLAS